jgi:hypothetical protein
VLRAYTSDQTHTFSSPGVSALEVCEHDVHHALGSWRNLVVVVWRSETQIPAIERCSALIGEVARRHGSAALLQIVEPTAVPPESEIRKAISAMLKGHARDLTCSAVVFEGDGFRAAGVRGVVTAISLLSRTPFPHVIFASPLSAINWTARHLSVDGPVWLEQARNAIDHLRAVIDENERVRDNPPELSAPVSYRPIRKS